jgi:BMFP domain-containing protein YqiC
MGLDAAPFAVLSSAETTEDTMQTENRIFDDLARVMGGAAGGLDGLRREVESWIQQRLRGLLADMDLVSREEFEAVKAMAAKARAEQERLAARLAALEETKAAGGSGQKSG